MIPRIGKVERIWPTRSFTDNPQDNPQDNMSNQQHKPRPEDDFASILQEELENPEPAQVEGPVKKLTLRSSIEISKEARTLYELSKRNNQ